MGAMWGHGKGLRHLLVIAELALCTMLLIGAGLLIRSFYRAKDVPPGFNPQNVLTLELTMAGPKYKDKQAVWNVYHELWQRLDSLPGVTASGAVTSLPLSQMFAWGPITVEGRVPPAGEKFINADTRMVSGRYFQAMEIPLLEGRLFNDHDVPANPGVAIVDSYMAEQLWPGQDAVGKRFHIGGIDDTKAPWITVVGVVGRVKQYTLDSDCSHRVLPAAHAVSDARDERGAAQRLRPCRPSRGRTATDSRDRRRSASLQRGDHGAPSEPFAGAAPIRDAAAWLLCVHLSGAGCHRDLWCTGLPGKPGHARDRHPHGTWRHSKCDSQPGGEQGYRARRRGSGDWRSGGLASYQADAWPSVRSEAYGRRHVLRDSPSAC